MTQIAQDEKNLRNLRHPRPSRNLWFNSVER